MSEKYIEGKDFKNVNYNDNEPQKGDYENCTFSNCIFANTNLAHFNFIECKFENCDLSMAKLKATSFRDVCFKGCKLLGLHFDDCNDFLLSFQFEDCVLNFSSFYKLKLKKSSFINCKLIEAEFVETNLTNSNFENCDLNGAVFENTILEKSDFRTSFNYSIDPEKNKMKKAKFSFQGIAGLLDKYNITIE
jgi:uncharacterized protein YjbI with pentapeptide repeats